MFTVKTRRNKLYFQRHNYAICIVVECCSELWRCRYCRCILPHEANFTLIGLTAHIALFINTTLVARLHALRWLGVQTAVQILPNMCIFKNIVLTAPNIMNRFKTFVFFDIEATGLPSLEFNATKMTELCMVACTSEALCSTASNELPRVMHKLSLCLNPFKRISLEAEKITGTFYCI